MPFPKNGHGTYVRFDNLAHVNDGIVMIQRYNLGVRFCTPIEFFSAQYPHAQDLQAINVHEGQVRIFVRVIGSPDAVVFIEDYVKRAAKHFGVVHTLAGPQHVAAFEDSYVLSWRIEFASVMDAMCCVKCFDMAMFANEPISVSLTANGFAGADQAKCGACTFLLMRAEMWSPVSTYERQLAGVYSRAMGLENRMAATADPTVGYPEHIMADHSRNNNVVRARILKGQDVRTTIMMRNIPSKMDWMTLKSIVDKYCFGEYDFFYLRIDFSSGSNVGYGFINFSEAMGVLKMVDNLAGRRLPGFHSSRELQISYATIQGKESLINKFRNSSVMYEAPYCKPRLFVPHADMTASVFSIGKEVLFPLPDNASKLQRSIHSARNVGLYPPHGTAGGGDHRDRRSMFDRGTPRDALVQSSQGEAHHAVYDLLPLWKRENLEAAYFQETGVWTVFRSIPQAFLESREGAPRPQRPRPAVVGGSSSSGPLGPIGGPVFAPAGAVPAPVQTGSALGRAAQRQI